MGGEYPGKKPLRLQTRKCGEFLGACGQQDVSRPLCQKGGGFSAAAYLHRAFRRAGGPQKPPQRRACAFAGGSDCGGDNLGVGVGGVYAGVKTGEQCLYRRLVQPARQYLDGGQACQLLGPKSGCHADSDLRPQSGGLLRQEAALRSAAKEQQPHGFAS